MRRLLQAAAFAVLVLALPVHAETLPATAGVGHAEWAMSVGRGYPDPGCHVYYSQLRMTLAVRINGRQALAGLTVKDYWNTSTTVDCGSDRFPWMAMTGSAQIGATSHAMGGGCSGHFGWLGLLQLSCPVWIDGIGTGTLRLSLTEDDTGNCEGTPVGYGCIFNSAVVGAKLRDG